MALGIAQGAYEEALTYATQRAQFGCPIAEFQGLQWMLADMSIGLAASRALLHAAAASAVDAASPICARRPRPKSWPRKQPTKVTNDALQIHGSSAYSRRRPLERHVRDARMFAIAGGTAQILRTQVAGAILGIKTPQTRDGHVRRGEARDVAAQ